VARMPPHQLCLISLVCSGWAAPPAPQIGLAQEPSQNEKWQRIAHWVQQDSVAAAGAGGLPAGLGAIYVSQDSPSESLSLDSLLENAQAAAPQVGKLARLIGLHSRWQAPTDPRQLSRWHASRAAQDLLQPAGWQASFISRTTICRAAPPLANPANILSSLRCFPCSAR
jgi:hypothetical protein